MLKSTIFLLIVGAAFAFGRSTNTVFNASSLESLEWVRELMEAEDNTVPKHWEHSRQKRSRIPKYYDNIQYDWTQYHPLNKTYIWMISLVLKYPKIAAMLNPGRSFENRALLGIKISHRKGNKGVFIEAGIHGREWISSATATYLIDQLINPRDAATRYLAEQFDWYIFPHTNPDGYVYSRSSRYNPLWRKNRSYRDNEKCIGVDLNRNWDFHWREDNDDSSYPCHETYAGPYPFSEVETKTLSQYISSLKGKIELYLSLHSFGQLILSPYDYTWKLPGNFHEYKLLMKAAEEGFSKRYKTKYRSGSTYNLLYPAYGTSTDWVYGMGYANLTLTLELRPSEKVRIISRAFILDTRQIIPTSEETLDAIVNILTEAQKMGYFKSSNSV